MSQPEDPPTAAPSPTATATPPQTLENGAPSGERPPVGPHGEVRVRRAWALVPLLAVIAAMALPGEAWAAATAYLDRPNGNVLWITSGSAGDKVRVECRGGNTTVNGSRVGQGCFVNYVRLYMLGGDDAVDLGEVGRPQYGWKSRVGTVEGTLGEGNDDFGTGDFFAARVAGGPGNDYMDGGQVDDILYGENGNDTLTGDEGDDALVGGPGRDLLDGRYGAFGILLSTHEVAGDDRLYGGAGGNTLGVNHRSSVGRDQMTSGCGSKVSARDNDDLDTIIADGQVEKDSGDRRIRVWCPVLHFKTWAPPSFRRVASSAVLWSTLSRTRFRAYEPGTRPRPIAITTPTTPAPEPPAPPAPSPGTPQCSDGIDNDGDTNVDHPDDPDCTSAGDNSEAGDAVTQCSDGVDNDGDGRFDYFANPFSDIGPDPDCSSPSDNSEAPSSASIASATAAAPAGATLRYRTSGNARRLEIRIDRILSGISRRPNRRPCLRRTKRRLRQIKRSLARRIRGSGRRRRIRRALARRRCNRLSPVGRLVYPRPSERTYRLTFTGEVKGRLLRRGRYLATLRTVDPDGKRSPPVFVEFRIVR